MNNLTLNSNLQSPLDYLSHLIGNSLEKILNRKLDELRKNLQEIKEYEQKHLEELNQYKSFNINDIDFIEKNLQSYILFNDLFDSYLGFIKSSKSRIDNDDEHYNDLVLLQNQIHEICAIFIKVTDKLSEIHNKILIKSSESISSDVLKDLWKDEEDVWDNFYTESQSK